MMNEQDRESHTQYYQGQGSELMTDQALEGRISHFFQQQTEPIKYTPALRQKVLQQLPSYRVSRPATRFAMGISLIAATLLIMMGIIYLSQNQLLPQSSISYISEKSIAVSPELANGGHLISLDPTEHHLIYQAANQPGVMYTADLANPVESNFLAMRYALDASWSPDGSALVATVAPEGSQMPLLALVPTGKYMSPLGHEAQAASWYPRDKQQITYILQSTGETELWKTTPDGATAQLLAKVPISLSVQHLLWSQNGQKLVLTAGTESPANKEIQSQASHELYILDVQTHKLKKLVQTGNFTIGAVAWSPDGLNLTYEQIDAQGKIMLQTIDMLKQQPSFNIRPQSILEGWSWSPDSRAVVYSDGGVLHTYILHGDTINLPKVDGEQISPFWLKNGRILSLQIKDGIGKLTFLERIHK